MLSRTLLSAALSIPLILACGVLRAQNDPSSPSSQSGAPPETGTMSPVQLWQSDPSTIFPADQIDLDAFQWIARPVVVFADSPNDPAFIEQIDLLRERITDLVTRDVVVIRDTDPDALSEVRRRLRPRGFMMALIGKDGTVKLRKPFPWSVREISRSIDKMPMRQRELREGS